MPPDGYRGPVPVEIERIDHWPAIRMRARVIDKTIQDYADQFDELPPILVIAGPNDIHWTADGSYRLAAAKLLGRKQINCYIKGGTEQDAWFDASRANAENRGERITSDDRIARVLTCYAHPIMGKWTQVRIAEYCNEKQQFVNHVLRHQYRNGIDGVEGKNGQVYSPTKPPRSHMQQEEKRSEILDDLRDDPTQPDTVIAQKHGVDYRMVNKVRKANDIPPSGSKGGSKYHRPRANGTPLLDPDPEVFTPVATPGPVIPDVVEAEAIAPTLTIAERWKSTEDVINRAFLSWPEADRSHFAFRLSRLSDSLFDQCPGVVDRSNEILH